MIKADELEERIGAYIRQNSGLQNRKYLGMSAVAKCPREAWRAYTQGVTDTDEHHRMCYVGYLFEADVLRRMVRMGEAKQVDMELIATGIDDRLRGHIDGLTAWGDLLEIKSVSRYKYDVIASQNRAWHEHYNQVQLYMRYGGWQYAWIVYVCRETFEHKVVRVTLDRKRGEELEAKARRILAAIDAGVPPMCECGRCER